MFAIGIEILAVESKKWQGYFESMFTGLPVIIEWFLRCFIDATLKYSQLPFQNGIAIVCRSKNKPTASKMAQVPYLMQNLVFLKNLCRAPLE